MTVTGKIQKFRMREIAVAQMKKGLMLEIIHFIVVKKLPAVSFVSLISCTK